MSVDPRRVFPAQPKEGLLHHVPCRVRVAKQPLRVADQRPLVAVERVNHPFGVWCPAHSGPHLDNGGVANLLDRDYGKVAWLARSDMPLCAALLGDAALGSPGRLLAASRFDAWRRRCLRPDLPSSLITRLTGRSRSGAPGEPLESS